MSKKTRCKIMQRVCFQIFRAERIPPPKKNLQSPQTAAQIVSSMNLFSSRDNDLQIYHGNFLLMDNKHRKLFVIKQSKGCKSVPKMHQNFRRSCSARTRWGSLCARFDPLVTMGGYF